jgi:hypothetical protein
LERAPMRRLIDAASHAADDNHFAPRKGRTQPPCNFERVGRRRARADDSNGGRAQNRDITFYPQRLWRIVDGCQGGGKPDVSPGKCKNVGAHTRSNRAVQAGA